MIYVKSAAGETADYKPSEDAISKPFTITTEQQVTTVTESVTFSQSGYTNAAEVSSVVIGDATVKFDKGSNSTLPKYYNTGTAIRAYGGNTIRFTGVTFTKITFFTPDSKNQKSMTVSDDTKLSAGTSVTWNGIKSNDLTFTIDGTSGHARITKIEITYEK